MNDYRLPRPLTLAATGQLLYRLLCPSQLLLDGPQLYLEVADLPVSGVVIAQGCVGYLRGFGSEG
jgi:hypothetical protein